MPAKYSNYANIFFTNLAIKLPENTRIYEHTIEFIDGKITSLQVYLCLKPTRVGDFENLN